MSKAQAAGRIETGAGEQSLSLSGEVGLADLPEIESRLSGWHARAPAEIDLSGAGRIDTSVAWALLSTADRMEDGGGQLAIVGANDSVARILETVRQAMPVPATEAPGRRGFAAWLERVGREVVDTAQAAAAFTGVLGLFVARLARCVIRPRELRLTALVHHCQDAGVRAVPIVALMAFLIGIVLAFQGAAQLRPFGAEVFVVELISISILRELGILLTAIIVAGRTASSYTAAIGSMKMRQEIDAMRTLGIDPGQALIVPRILALVLMLPILGLVANLAGLFGGGLMAWLELGISPAMFVTRLAEGTDVSNLTVGMIKAPVFAVLIGVIGCEAGLRVGDTAESLGRMTSAAVVAAIFAVIVADALFSIFFEQVGM
ncbi:MlaE family lipid ABC transporter permease subunit [Rhodovulum sp. 12E13]|uniref:MlaE family lipid ABC transporter permease subunit n=1 Tax=Rhodovulum sp. 12E13 TaxID=2203891 RepID=UPI000E125F49|nr:MlaE family lipid ABC transporter permease subunit [Rhodovulum sp. 12E13]RDC75185.1 MlaE family lipid ABC transporter permease subunit [Rhodovulum sp. 12E13]